MQRDIVRTKYWWITVISLKNMVSIPVFLDAFSVYGGSMFLLNLFCEEYCKEKGEGLIGENPYNFSVVLQEKRKLFSALVPVKTFIEDEPPKWTNCNLTKVIYKRWLSVIIPCCCPLSLLMTCSIQLV